VAQPLKTKKTPEGKGLLKNFAYCYFQKKIRGSTEAPYTPEKLVAGNDQCLLDNERIRVGADFHRGYLGDSAVSGSAGKGKFTTQRDTAINIGTPKRKLAVTSPVLLPTGLSVAAMGTVMELQPTPFYRKFTTLP
jgi:hypothetical protein